jgi:hypothetical protein
MSIARTSLEGHTRAAAGHPDQAVRHPRASKLFEKEHAYAARVVQISTAIRSVVRSTITLKLPDQEPLEIQQDDGVMTGVVTQPREHGSGP